MGAVVAGNHGTADEPTGVLDRHWLRDVLQAQDQPNPEWLAGATTVEDSYGIKRKINPRLDYASDPTVLDEAMADGRSLWAERPSPSSEYTPLLRGIADPLGRAQGLTTSQAQAAMWPGSDKRLVDFLADRIRETADASGKTFEETMREFASGDTRLLGVPVGLLAALRAMMGSEESDDA
jgi:hypothetical protein